MSVNSIASQSVFVNTTPSATKSSNSSAIVSASDTSPTTATSSDATISTPYGFKVDENGFFGADFNKAAGLPENMKVHQKMMDMASEYANALGGNTDPLAIVSKVWNLYKTVAGSTLDPDGTGYMTQAEVDKMPKGYVSKGSLLDGVTSVQGTMAEYGAKLKENGALFRASLSINNDNDTLAHLKHSLDNGMRAFSGLTFGDNLLKTCSDEYERNTKVPYEDKQSDGKISVAELFGSFFFMNVNSEIEDAKASSNGTGTQSVADKTRNYDKFLESGKDIKSYLTGTYGNDYLANLTKQLGTDLEGKFHQSMVDTFFDTLDKELTQSREEYQANNYPPLDSTSVKLTDNSASKQLSQGYQTTQNIKLPMAGSLINVGA
jgi:hypothetical protein